jgi:hypothetical protein
MWKLRNFDPFEADPSGIRIAVITDEIVQLEDDAVSLELGFRSADSHYNFNTAAKAKVKANAMVDQLGQYKQDSQRITLFYLSGNATDEIRLAQNRLRIIKQNEIQGEGSLGINVHVGCFNGAKPETILANVYAQFSPDQAYTKMVSNIDLLGQTDSSDDQFWHECPKLNSTTSSQPATK